MIKKAIIIIICFNSVRFLSGCCGLDYYVQWRDFIIEEYDGNHLLSSPDEVSFQDYLIKLMLMDSTIVVLPHCSNGILFPSAMAFTPAEYLVKVNELKDISIYSLYDLNEEYPADSKINDLFEARFGKENAQPVNTAEAIMLLNNQQYRYSDSQFFLRFRDSINFRGKIKFRIVLKFTDTHEVTRETMEVELI